MPTNPHMMPGIKMKVTKSQLKQIIKEEVGHLVEVEYDNAGPIYAEPEEGPATPDEAEVLVPGFGGLRIGQIKDKLVSELNQMADAANNGELRKIGASRLKLLTLFLDTLNQHGALGD
jgi:hypothetical protein